MVKINEAGHFINNIDMDNVDLSLNVIIKDPNAEYIYSSKEMVISEELTAFLGTHIINELEDLKVDGNYNLSEYNNELQINDTISYYNYSVKNDEDTIKSRIQLLTDAITSDQLEEVERCKFQIAKLDIEDNTIFFCFYKGVKKNSRKRKLAIFNPNELTEIQERILEIGGPLAFFFDHENIYIIRVKEFEYAFNYTDHIAQKSTENLSYISNLGVFINEETKDNFCKKASNTFHLRGLANMKEETLQNLQMHYNDRIDELKEISDNLARFTGSEREEYLGEIGDLSDLIQHFDFEERKIIFNEDDSPTIILHFFQDKIMKSFLTHRIRSVVG